MNLLIAWLIISVGKMDWYWYLIAFVVFCMDLNLRAKMQKVSDFRIFQSLNFMFGALAHKIETGEIALKAKTEEKKELETAP